MRITAKFENVPTPAKPAPKPEAASGPSPAARNLALAHYIDRLIERGIIADYTQAARMLGVSQARMTHVMGLLLLSPAVQEAILLGVLVTKDKALRELARVTSWDAQTTRIRL